MRKIKKYEIFWGWKEGVWNISDFIVTEIDILDLDQEGCTLEKDGKFSMDYILLWLA